LAEPLQNEFYMANMVLTWPAHDNAVIDEHKTT